MSKHCSIPRAILGALVVVMVAGASSAYAQATDCVTTGSNLTQCYHFKGSDTLFEIMTAAINQARAANIAGANNLFYDGTGSGNAESQMRVNTGAGAPVTGATLPLGVQSIGPMSRNFRPSVIDTASVNFAAADGVTATRQGHASWAPTCQNVVALDAAVFVTRGAGKGSSLKNVGFPVFSDLANPAEGVNRASTNNTAATVAFGDGSAFNSATPTTAVNYSNPLMIILSGVDGSGTLAACSDPRRVQAVQDLAKKTGAASTIDHIYRRDDNSGTTDTFKDRIMTVASTSDPLYPWVGGRFCNGQSIGGINGSTPQTGICSVTRTNTTCKVDADCNPLPPLPTNGEVCQFNLNNQDLDPIRRPCVAADATHAPTSCTDMTTGKPCQAGDGNANCTQGLIVALTDNDPGSVDITTSIAARIAGDATGQTVGYAGREAAAGSRGTRGLSINTTASSDTNVRNAAYLLARRLFLQNSLVAGQPVADQPSITAGPSLSLTGKGSAQLTAEQNLFLYMTDPAGSLTNGQSGRKLIDPIVKSLNMVACTDPKQPTKDPCTISGNLCATPAGAVAGALSAYLPNGSFAAAGAGGAKSIDSQGRGWNGTTAVQVACTGTTLCASGACSNLVCPIANGRPPNAACSQNSDCASNVCQDTFLVGASPAYLLCQ